MEFLKLKDLNIYHGIEGQGKPVIFLHGNPADHRSMMSAFEPIFSGRENWQRIYLDLPGMGQTKALDRITHIDHMLEVVLDFIDTVIPGKRFLLIGESFGGYLAQGVVHRKADLVDGLFLLTPSVKPNAPDRRIPEKRIVHADKAYVDSLTPELQEALGQVATVHTSRIGDDLIKDYISAIQISDQPFLGRLRQNFAYSFDLYTSSTRYEFPALIITGRQDTIVGYEDQIQLHKYYPRGTVVVLDRGAHVSELEQPVLFRALTNEWLDRVEEFIR